MINNGDYSVHFLLFPGLVLLSPHFLFRFQFPQFGHVYDFMEFDRLDSLLIHCFQNDLTNFFTIVYPLFLRVT
jgi:hypothetical protein